jgi:hypothetical protein
MPTHPMKNTHISRKKSNTNSKDLGCGDPSTVSVPTDIVSRDENQDIQMDESDTSSTSLAREGIHEDTRHRPKRNKKMKIEKTSEHQPERSRSLPRRLTYKNGKY